LFVRVFFIPFLPNNFLREGALSHHLFGPPRGLIPKESQQTGGGIIAQAIDESRKEIKHANIFTRIAKNHLQT